MAFKKEEIVIIEPKDIYVGKKDAPVTITEFGDYESEACAKANDVVRQQTTTQDGRPTVNSSRVRAVAVRRLAQQQQSTVSHIVADHS